MDKLKPLMKHRFWVLFGVVLLIPFIGWWLATAQLNAEYIKREEEIKKAFSQAEFKPGTPNQQWDESLVEYIADQKERNKEAREFLWNLQSKLMKWPDILKRYIPEQYYGPLATAACNIYRNEYPKELERVWRAIDPYDPVYLPKGTVIFQPGTMPRRTYGSLPPTPKNVWEAQQDLWLLEGLFDVVRKVNSTSTSPTESKIRSVDVLRLVGGTGSPADAAAMGEEMGMPEGFAAFAGAGQNTGAVSFDPADEFGPEAIAAAGGEGGEFDPSMMGMGAAGGTMFNPDGTEIETALRWVGPTQEREGQNYMQRGFYMEVYMDHRHLAEFLVELENSPWLISVVRVQMGRSGGSQGVNQGGGGMFAEGGYGGGFGGGGPGGFGGGGFGPGGGGFGGNPGGGFGAAVSRPGGATSGQAPPLVNPFLGGGPTVLDRGNGSNVRGPAFGRQNDPAADVLNAVKSGPYIYHVAISGLFTLYNPPPSEEVVAEAPLDPAVVDPGLVDPSVDPAVVDPNAVPVDPSMIDPNAVPGVDPNAPTSPALPADGVTPTSPDPNVLGLPVETPAAAPMTPESNPLGLPATAPASESPPQAPPGLPPEGVPVTEP